MSLTVFSHDSCFNTFKDSLISISNISILLCIDKIPENIDKEKDLKVFWSVEPRSICPEIVNSVQSNHPQFHKILTYDNKLLLLPQSTLFLFGTSFINEASQKEYNELFLNKKIQFGITGVFSSKIYCSGHELRHLIYNNQCLINIPYTFFRGANNPLSPIFPDKNPIAIRDPNQKHHCFNNNMFHLAMENTSSPNYFTEKLLDCFLLKVVPVYWGCDNVSNYFDPRGIIRCSSSSKNQTKSDLISNAQNIINTINSLTPQDYYSRLPFIENNYKIAKMYQDLESRFTHYYSKVFRRVNTLYIVPKGGYGNILFTVLYGLCTSKLYNKIPIFINNYQDHRPNITQYPNFNKKLHFINKTMNGILQNNSIKLIQEKSFFYDTSNILLNNKDDFLANGYFQSRKYFEPYTDSIRAYLYSEFDKLENRERRSGNCTVALHIRRGDYLQLQNIHPVQDISYYIQSISIMKSMYPNCKFLIFTDTPDFVQNQNVFRSSEYKLVKSLETSPKSIEEEHNLMRSCDHFIISNSSFSLTAYYLRNSIKDSTIVSPRNWFGPNGPHYNIYDLVPEHAILI
jgi:hypothetical protein